MVEDGRVDGYTSATYGDAFADVYDDWYGDLADRDATISTVAALTPAGGRVLELGVGTGRLAVPLATALRPNDATVTGIDTSAAMLERLGHRDVRRRGGHASRRHGRRPAGRSVRRGARGVQHAVQRARRGRSAALPRRRRRTARADRSPARRGVRPRRRCSPLATTSACVRCAPTRSSSACRVPHRTSASKGSTSPSARAAVCVCGRGRSAGRPRISSTTWPGAPGSFRPVDGLRSAVRVHPAQHSTRQRVRHPRSARGGERLGKKRSRLNVL